MARTATKTANVEFEFNKVTKNKAGTPQQVVFMDPESDRSPIYRPVENIAEWAPKSVADVADDFDALTAKLKGSTLPTVLGIKLS